MFTYNDPKRKPRRKELRKQETAEEKLLWSELRRKGLGYKFYRQYSVGPYILDFYCAKKRIAIELDGSQHLQDKEYDKQRDDYLTFNDIKVLRFWNRDVRSSIEKVMGEILRELSSPYVGGGKVGV